MNTLLTALSYDRLKRHYKDGHWGEETIYQTARKNAVAVPDKIAVRESGRQISYSELIRAADGLADELSQAGLRSGQRVACWLPSRIEVAIAVLACSREGYVVCTSLHRDHTVNDVVLLLERMRASAFIYEAGYGADGREQDVGQLAAKCASLRCTIKLAPLSASAPQQIFDMGQSFGERKSPSVNEPDTAVYLAFTSGTTGTPKGVLHSDNTLLSNAKAIAGDWAFKGADVIYTLSPLSHNLGFGAMILALLTGSELVVHDLARGKSLVERVIETKTTFLFGVPTHAIDLLTEMQQLQLDSLGAVRGFRVSGAAMSKKTVNDLLARGILPQSGYGMTEACSHHYTLPTDDPALISETSGRPCPGYELKIWSETNPDVEVPSGTIGQIGGRGNSLMLGYFNDQFATEESFNSLGWYMTGDLGWVDDNGYLRITGRKKDLIIRGGHNIYPAKIEELAGRHPAVRHVAVLPVPDARLGEKVCIAVSLKEGRSLEPQGLLNHLNEVGLSKFDMPEYYVQLDSLPLTASGKVLKRELVSQIAAKSVTVTPIRWQQEAKA